MRDNAVKAKLKRGEAVIGTMVTEFDNPALAVMLADAGFDFMILDMEHGAYTLAQAAHLFLAARLANITPLVRVADGMYHLIAPALDAGAMGIVVPRVETREVVEHAVAVTHYPPVGVRGMFGGKANNDYVAPQMLAYAHHANEHVLIIIQIESRAAVERAEELLATPGLDGALVGPWDLALSLGVDPGAPLAMEMTRRVITAARKNKIASGIHTGDPAQARYWQAQGMTFLTCLTDLEMMRNAAQSVVRALRE